MQFFIRRHVRRAGFFARFQPSLPKYFHHSDHIDIASNQTLTCPDSIAAVSSNQKEHRYDIDQTRSRNANQ